jgi:hypothetical protein
MNERAAGGFPSTAFCSEPVVAVYQQSRCSSLPFRLSSVPVVAVAAAYLLDMKMDAAVSRDGPLFKRRRPSSRANQAINTNLMM